MVVGKFDRRLVLVLFRQFFLANYVGDFAKNQLGTTPKVLLQYIMSLRGRLEDPVMEMGFFCEGGVMC